MKTVSCDYNVKPHSWHCLKMTCVYKNEQGQVTYSWDCDSQVHRDAGFGAGAQRVAAD